jgi:hypothetical protein
LRALTFVLVALVAMACTPRDRAVRLERLAAQRRSLDLTFERLEARFVATQARVRFWDEIRARHESVSAISCASQDEHAEEMARHFLPPAPGGPRARVASVAPSRAAGRVPAAAPARSVAVQTRVRN